MIEHYDNLKYNLDDIKNRLINATQEDQKYSLAVERVNTSKDFIFCLCRKISLDDSYDRSIKEFEFWVCQLKDNKICEAWCMVDKVVPSNHLEPIFSADCGNTSCGFPMAML